MGREYTFVMHMHGGHSHHGDWHGPNTARVLRISLVLTVAYIVLLVVAGIHSHSLALLSEAGHNISDFLALLLSWFAVYMAGRPPSSTKTYGYQRAGVLAAFVNASSLLIISLLILLEAIHRLYRPEQVQAKTMMWAAFAGVVLNGLIALMLMRSHRDINIRSALVHEVGDTLSTAAVIFGGWMIMLTGRQWIDPALSILIAGLVLWSSFGIIRESLNILLEGTPHGIELANIFDGLSTVEGVRSVHDLHVWSIGSNLHALSCHIHIEDIPPSESDVILARVRKMLAERFNIRHATIQFESVTCQATDGCVMTLHDTHDHSQHSHPHSH